MADNWPPLAAGVDDPADESEPPQPANPKSASKPMMGKKKIEIRARREREAAEGMLPSM